MGQSVAVHCYLRLRMKNSAELAPTLLECMPSFGRSPLEWRPADCSDISCHVLCRFVFQLNCSLVVTAATTVRGATAAVISGQGMFIPAIVGSIAYVAVGIMCFVSLKVVEGLSSTWG